MVEFRETAVVKDDLALVAEAKAGSYEAFEELVSRYESKIYRLGVNITGNSEDAEDVLQDAFVQVWKTVRSFDDQRGKPLAWLIMLTRSRAIDRLRSRQTRARATEAAGQELAGDPPLPAEEAAAAENRSLVRRVVQTLPAEQRQPIELAYFGGLTQTEIATQLGQPLGTVKTRMRAGMLRLREQLSPPGGLS